MMRFKETENLELKKSTSELKEAVISICAILNKSGSGKTYFGIKDDGTPIGQMISNKTIRDVTRTISEHIEPRVYPEVKEMLIQGKHCIIVEFKGHESPYFAYGRAYIRVGDEDRLMSVRELEKFIINKNLNGYYWDKIVSNMTIDSIAEASIKQYITRVNNVGRGTIIYKNKKALLNKFGLLQGKKLLNGAAVLFSNKSGMELKLATFVGYNKTQFIDLKTF